MRIFWEGTDEINLAKQRIFNGEFIHNFELEKFSYRDKVVLDFGCGVGRNLKYLIGTGTRMLIGYDFPTMIRLAKEYLNEEEIRKVAWVVPPLEDWLGILPKFDIVISILTFQHFEVEELDQVIRSLNKGITDNGFMYVHSRGYLDECAGSVWDHLLKGFYPVTPLDISDSSENHQSVIFSPLRVGGEL